MNRQTNPIYDKINQDTDIVALVSEYVSLTKRGKNFMGLCPFHDEKTPSFSVSPEKQLAVCMGCRKGGPPISFLSLIKNISYQDAAQELAEKLGIEFRTTKAKVDPNQKLYELMKAASSFYQFALKNSKSGSDATKYLEKRSMTDDDIKHFEIGYAPSQFDALYQMLKSENYTVSDMMSLGLVKQNESGDYYDVFRDRITFPIKDIRGNVIGFSGRSLNINEIAKYINSTETLIFKKGEALYNINNATRAAVKQKSVILHEGFFDVIQSHKAGFEASVATMGTALTQNQATMIRQISNKVIIAYDGDSAGVNATLSSIPNLKAAGLDVMVLNLPDKMDPDDFVSKYGIPQYKKLYKTNLVDPYQFGYEFYKKDKDFNKAGDITLFKKEINKLFNKSDITIKEFYQNKISEEIGINIYLSSSEAGLPPKIQRIIPRRIVSRAQNAIDTIIINLLQENTYLEEIEKRLDLTKMITPLQRDLFKEIITYYDRTKDEVLDLEKFTTAYTKHQDKLKIYTDRVDFKKKLTIKSDETFDTLVKEIDEYQYQLKLESMVDDLVKEEDEKKIQKYLSEIQKLKKRGKVN